ncbi:MAG: SemiSWEET family transporter [Candidatus Bathyarchaeota archaeon]|nr:SemiSWEET family transporter [Candidatus Bathyarchaeota archaeon]
MQSIKQLQWRWNHYQFKDRKLNSQPPPNKVGMDIITIVGLVASVFTTISLSPQLLKSWRTRWKPSKDNTVAMFSLLFCVGIFLWLLYGIWKADLPMIVANTLGFLQGLLILIIQIRRLRIKPAYVFSKTTD